MKLRFKKVKFTLLLLLTIGFGAQYTCAQTSVNSSGGNSSGTEGSVSYSVGQVVNNICSGSSGSVHEGIQLPWEISVISGVERTDINLNLVAYPNPTTNDLFLTLDRLEQVSSTYYAVFDNAGKMLSNNKIIDRSTTISMRGLPIGIYYLKIFQNEKDIKTFKIIKK